MAKLMHMYKRKLFEHPIPSFFFYLIISEIVFDGFGKVFCNDTPLATRQ